MDVHDLETGFEDLENLSDLSSDPNTTYVILTHASLGDFFGNECNGPVSADGCPSIGVNYHEARVMLFKRYYEIISCPGSSPKDDIATVLLLRASSSVIPALKAIDIHKCSKTDKQTIETCLARLLSDEWAMARFIMFTGDVPEPKDILDLLIAWLCDSDLREALQPDERAWVDKFASGNFLDVFLSLSGS